MELVTVFQTLYPAEAELVQTQLDAAGFDSMIANELSTITFGPPAANAAGILVQVPADQADDARELIVSPVESSATPPVTRE